MKYGLDASKTTKYMSKIPGTSFYQNQESNTTASGAGGKVGIGVREGGVICVCIGVKLR